MELECVCYRDDSFIGHRLWLTDLPPIGNSKLSPPVLPPMFPVIFRQEFLNRVKCCVKVSKTNSQRMGLKSNQLLLLKICHFYQSVAKIGKFSGCCYKRHLQMLKIEYLFMVGICTSVRETFIWASGVKIFALTNQTFIVGDDLSVLTASKCKQWKVTNDVIL